MKVLLVALAVVVVVGIAAIVFLKYRIDNTQDKRNLAGSIDSEVDKLAKNGLSHDLVIGLYKDGKTFFKGYGGVDRDRDVMPDESTVFQVGSVSKLFTASLLKILCDEKVVAMESTLDELIGERYPLSPAAKSVTLQQLVTHTSGFPRVPKSLMNTMTRKAGKKKILDNPYSHIDFSDVTDYLKTSEGKRKPGSFEYSNFGTGLLGHILEVVTGKDLEYLAREKLFAPLSMDSTAIRLTDDMEKSLAQGYSAKGNEAELWTFGALAGAGAFHSTAGDMMKFVLANIMDDAPISASLKAMQDPSGVADTGIGWMRPGFLDRFLGNKTIAWHNGMVGGYASYIAVDRQREIGVVVLSGKAADVTMLGMMLMGQARTQSWSP